VIQLLGSYKNCLPVRKWAVQRFDMEIFNLTKQTDGLFLMPVCRKHVNVVCLKTGQAEHRAVGGTQTAIQLVETDILNIHNG
jgi:hypothetical protein